MWGGCGDGGSSRSSLEICSVPVELGLAGVLKGLKGQGKGVWRVEGLLADFKIGERKQSQVLLINAQTK